MGGPQQAPKGAGCAVRVTRQYLFCLARMRTPLVRNVARTLPRLSGRPRTLPPPGCCGERRPRGGKEDSLFLFADVAGGCVTRLLFFCPPAWEAWPCLPANMQGWRVVWATEDRLPPTRQASPPLKQHTCCAQRAPRMGAKQRSRTRGRPPLRLVAVPGGRRSCSAAEATAAAAAVVHQCCCCWALFFERPYWGTFSLWQDFFGDCGRAPRERRWWPVVVPPLGALPALFM